MIPAAACGVFQFGAGEIGKGLESTGTEERFQIWAAYSGECEEMIDGGKCGLRRLAGVGAAGLAIDPDHVDPFRFVCFT